MIQPFDKGVHDRSAFDCGDDLLNDWLQKQVSQYEKRGLARTYVLVTDDDPTIQGFYAINAGEYLEMVARNLRHLRHDRHENRVIDAK